MTPYMESVDCISEKAWYFRRITVKQRGVLGRNKSLELLGVEASSRCCVSPLLIIATFE